MLYDSVKDTTVQLLRPIADEIKMNHDERFLKEFNRVWKEIKECIVMIRDILLYMNKNYVPKFNLPLVEEMQYSQFKHHVIQNPVIKERLIQLLIKEIRAEREGEVIEKTQIRSSIQMLIEVCKNSRKLYEQEFERVLLKETTDYYRVESQSMIVDSSCASYLEKGRRRLLQEYDRVASYLDASTEVKLINTFLSEYLSDVHSQTLLTMQSGLVHMIRNNNIDELSLVYNMFHRRPASFELMRKHLADFIISEGNKMVNEEQKNDELVVKLMDLRDRVSGIQNSAMDKDT